MERTGESRLALGKTYGETEVHCSEVLEKDVFPPYPLWIIQRLSHWPVAASEGCTVDHSYAFAQLLVNTT